MLFRLIVPMLAALMLGSPVTAPPAARPGLWRISAGGAQLYLFGTVHRLPPRLPWLNGWVATALDESDMVLLESAGPLPPPRPSAWRRAAAREGAALDAAGLSPVFGGEAVLARVAARRGMAVHGFETTRAAIDRLDAIDPAAQAAIAARAPSPLAARAVIGRWAAGDAGAAARQARRELSPALAARLIDAPDTLYARAIADRLARRAPRSFVAIGAGHVPGVLARLRAHGLTVRRLQ